MVIALSEVQFRLKLNAWLQNLYDAKQEPICCHKFDFGLKLCDTKYTYHFTVFISTLISVLPKSCTIAKFAMNIVIVQNFIRSKIVKMLKKMKVVSNDYKTT